MAKEYIERERVIHEIFCNSVVAFVDTKVLASIVGKINLIPTADVVEVVRCCNCIHLKIDSIDRIPYCEIHSTKLDKFYVRTDDYCSYGERKEQEDELL